jgi:hypothetical protein
MTKRHTKICKTLHRKLNIEQQEQFLQLCLREDDDYVDSFMASDDPFGIFKRLVIVLSDLLFMTSDYSFGIFKCLVTVLSDLR